MKGKKSPLVSYMKELFGFSGRNVVIELCITIFLGFTQGIGLVMLIPLLYLTGIVTESRGSMGFIAYVISAFKRTGIPLTVPVVLLIYVLIISIHSILKYYQLVLNVSIQQGIICHLRIRLYKSLAYADWLFFVRHRSSDLMHVLTDALQHVGSGTFFLLNFIVNLVIALVHVIFAFLISVPMTILAVACAFILLILQRPRYRVSRETGKSIFKGTQGLYATIHEHLSGMKAAKSYGAESYHIGQFEGLNNSILLEYIRFVRSKAGLQIIYDIGSVITISILFYFAVSILNMPIASLLIMVYVFARLIPYISRLHQDFQNIINMLPAFEEVASFYQYTVGSREFQTKTNISPIILKKQIMLKDVWFRYDRSNGNHVLSDINLVIPANSMTAIIGPSGSGKTTFADLLMGLLKPEKGAIFFDDIPLTHEHLQAWRQSIGYVPQEDFLFHDSIRANLQWAAPEAGDEDLIHALRLSAAYDFVQRLPNGLDSIVGDRGERLSGGERQRLALARALLRKPTLLVLDEATSFLDAENETKIQKAIEGLHGELTIIIIAHRLSTVREADNIVVLSSGRIVDICSWGELERDDKGYLNRIIMDY